MAAQPWLRRRRPGVERDWGYVIYWALNAAFIALGVVVLKTQLDRYVPAPQNLFSDASLYLTPPRRPGWTVATRGR